jgi:hypothetical protein
MLSNSAKNEQTIFLTIFSAMGCNGQPIALTDAHFFAGHFFVQKNVQVKTAGFGPKKPVSKAFLGGVFKEIHPTSVTTTFKKV